MHKCFSNEKEQTDSVAFSHAVENQKLSQRTQ